MSFKGTLLVLVVAAAVLAVTFSTPYATSQGHMVVSDLRITPDPPVKDEKFTVSCKIAAPATIKSVFLFYCSNLNCFPPIEMTKDASDVYSATSNIPINSLGQHHFNVTVVYANDSREWTEDQSFTPVEKAATGLECTLLSRQPQDVKAGESVDIYCAPEDPANVSSMQVLVNQSGTVLATVDMARLGNGTYHARIGPFAEGKEVSWNVTATLKSGGKAWTADLKFTPAKKSEGKKGFIPTVGAVAVLAVLAGFAVTMERRRKR